jgi:formylglycine-generating enzyme required for sulfatase activity
MQICRLSWFVNGEMPDETRTALLHYLEQNDAPLLAHLRAAMAEELQRNPPPTDSAAYDKFRLNIALNQWLTTTDAQKKKDLEAEVADLLAQGAEPDFTVLKYLNAPRTPLDFIVPDAWKKFVHPSGFAGLGWLKGWKDVRWVLLLVILGLVGVFYPYQFKTFDCNKNKVVSLNKYGKTYYFCLDEPLGNAVYHEELILKDFIVARDTLASPNLVRSFNDFLLIQDSLSIERILNKAEEQDSAIHRLLNECNRNFAVNFYKLAKAYYDIGIVERQNACLILADAALFDSLDNDIKLAQFFLCGNTDKNRNPPFSIAPAIRGRVMDLTNAEYSPDEYTDDFMIGESLANVQVSGISVNTRTDGNGYFILKLPPQYPDSAITLTFTKRGYTPVTQTFMINKVTQLNVVSLVPNGEEALSIAPVITGVVMSLSNVTLTDSEGPLSDNEGTLLASGENGQPVADVLVRGNGVNTRTDAKGNYELRLPPQYPDSTITLTFTKKGIKVVNTFMINKVKQLPKVIFALDATKILVPVMVEVKGGTFQMGSDDGESNEKPIHRVTLSDFSIGKFEVTNAQFCQFLNEKGNQSEEKVEWVDLKSSYSNEKCRIQAQGKGFIVEKGYEDYPIIYVNHYGAIAYAQWLSSKTGKKYRLPTEAEWEYAARGGNRSKGFIYSGSNTVGDVAWYYNNSDNKSHSIGGKKANELGLHDMSGNVWEWCSDWYDENYYKKSAAQNPKGTDLGADRVLRGGSWNRDAGRCRAANRSNIAPTYRYFILGFRLVLSLR